MTSASLDIGVWVTAWSPIIRLSFSICIHLCHILCILNIYFKYTSYSWILFIGRAPKFCTAHRRITIIFHNRVDLTQRGCCQQFTAVINRQRPHLAMLIYSVMDASRNVLHSPLKKEFRYGFIQRTGPIVIHNNSTSLNMGYCSPQSGQPFCSAISTQARWGV